MKRLKKTLKTPLGWMLASASEEVLYSLEFIEEPVIESGSSSILDSIEKEIEGYFKGELKEFKTPFHLEGSSFQKKVWKSLQSISYGTTCSYSNLAEAINHPKAFRAVGSANGANVLAIIIPCHRVILSGGKLGGYAAGLERKKWLLNHEVHYAT